MPDTRLVRVDLTGSPLGPGWKRVAVEIDPAGLADTDLAAAAAAFYGVPAGQVRVQAAGPPRARFTCERHQWFDDTAACPRCEEPATLTEIAGAGHGRFEF